jgi:hypothetical protein
MEIRREIVKKIIEITLRLALHKFVGRINFRKWLYYSVAKQIILENFRMETDKTDERMTHLGKIYSTHLRPISAYFRDMLTLGKQCRHI